MVRLVFLGKFGEMAPADLSEVTLPGGVRTLSDLQAWLGEKAPLLARAMAATRTRLVLNQEVVHDLSRVLVSGDEIAFLPPMSGG
jgi:molybdopterin converting factor small subunit